jgi:thiol-disulfide isomerase/thioredoxin
MISRRTFGIAVLTAIVAKPAFAQSEVPFSHSAFEAAQKDGKSILVEIHASWCPTCKAQKPIIESLLGTPKYKNLVTFRMDFDAQAQEVRAMGAQSQSTLVVFKGSKEVGRSVGDTNPASIEQLMAAGI